MKHPLVVVLVVRDAVWSKNFFLDFQVSGLFATRIRLLVSPHKTFMVSVLHPKKRPTHDNFLENFFWLSRLRKEREV